ncbi:MAG: hypothetical protein MHPSP_001207, partial [Paramarteilia canceri]
VNSINKGDLILIDLKPSKVQKMTTAKTGKHGHAKASIFCVEFFRKDQKKIECSHPTSHNIQCPKLENREGIIQDLTSIPGPDGQPIFTVKTQSSKNEEFEYQIDKEQYERTKAAVDSGKNVIVQTTHWRNYFLYDFKVQT